MSDDKPVIVIKKKGGHGGHHGGAWKVAYADFVTAMMAFFMVMWLVNTADVATKQNIASYFRRPGIFAEGSGTPLMIGEAGILTEAYVPPNPSEQREARGKGQEMLKERSGTDAADLDERLTPMGIQGEGGPGAETDQQGYLPDGSTEQDPGVGKDGFGGELERFGPDALEDIEQQRRNFERVVQQIEFEIQRFPKLQEMIGSIEVSVDSNGLKIEIMDTEQRSMFRGASPEIREDSRAAFARVAAILKTLPNQIDIFGHTDAIPFSSRQGSYTNWELSGDRANSARRVLEEEGIPSERIRSVVGMADRDLKRSQNPFSAANRRITLRLPFVLPSEQQVEEQDQLIDEISKRKLNGDPIRLTPAEIAKSRDRDKSTVPVPEHTPETSRPEFATPDPIFDEIPVIGPADPFKGLSP